MVVLVDLSVHCRGDYVDSREGIGNRVHSKLSSQDGHKQDVILWNIMILQAREEGGVGRGKKFAIYSYAYGRADTYYSMSERGLTKSTLIAMMAAAPVATVASISTTWHSAMSAGSRRKWSC